MFRRMLVATIIVLALSGCGGSKSQIENLPGIDTIIDGSFVVAPRTFKPFEIVVAAGMSNPRIEGTFTASGANNDIEVLLLDEFQFNNWQNRHEFKSAYTSGRVTADKVRVELPSEPGKYFLIFSNRFSIFSNKGVVADLRLRYDNGR